MASTNRIQLMCKSLCIGKSNQYVAAVSVIQSLLMAVESLSLQLYCLGETGDDRSKGSWLGEGS